MTTLVCYHLPSDRDDAEHPNAFVVKKFAEDVTLKDVKSNFPLPGEYHFRFKTKFDSGAVYWIDATDDSAKVPLFGSNKIVAKVLRLSWNNPRKPDPAPVTATRPVTIANNKMHDLFGSNSPATQKPAAAKLPHVGDLDLFG